MAFEPFMDVLEGLVVKKKGEKEQRSMQKEAYQGLK